MKEFADCFTEKAVIEELCKQRINRSIPLHRQAFYDRISNNRRNPKDRAANQSDDLDGLFPARKIWSRYKPLPKQRKSMSARQVYLASLITAVHKLMAKNPSLPWVGRLIERAAKIRCRALEEEDCFFRHQCIVGQKKKPGTREYRPITKYPTDDNIIQKLTLRYLSDKLDPFFSESSYAYRNRRHPSVGKINRDSALRGITAFRELHKTVYVAEADIRNFMDCVDHETARKSLRSLIAQTKENVPGMDVDRRAIRWYDALISSYSFKRDVLGTATEQLVKKDKKGYFAWPAEELSKMHGGHDLEAIGIPQGGALSCFVVNVLLHEVDQAVKNTGMPDGCDMLYGRFCDDMIILTTDKDACQRAMQAYLAAIRRKKLLLHEPVDVPHSIDHGSLFHILDLKSKNPYLWAPRADGGMPWIQFLGYLIQYDGQFQIRPKSIRKQIQKMKDEAKTLCKLIHPKAESPHEIVPHAALKMKPGEILMRFYKKLVAMSVGRRNHRQPLPTCKDDIKPMCWAKGYEYLWEVPYDPTQLRELDGHRERIMKRIYRQLEPFMLSKEDRKVADAIMMRIGKYGSRYSYYGQFAKKAEAGPSLAHGNASTCNDLKTRFKHVVSSIFRWLGRWRSQK